MSISAQAPVFAAPPKPFAPTQSAKVPSVKTRPIAAGKPVADTSRPASASPAAVWPAPSTAELDVIAAQPGAVADAKAAAPTGPVTVARPASAKQARSTAAVSAAVPARVRVEVLDQQASAKANVRGLLLKVDRADNKAGTGSVNVTVDYAAFATAYGADWSTRLRLVELPSCALTTPGLPQCRATALPSRNDTVANRVSADVVVGTPAGVSPQAAAAGGARIVALTAGASGAAGSYGATSLSASGTWSAGGSSGDFSWSYPMRTPPALGGPSPTLQVTYSAQSVDGRMVTSNNQPSIVGEGFELSTSGYIERRYKSCGEDQANGGNNSVKTGDQCWATDNATMSLNGGGSELIRDNSDPNKWHPRNDDGSRIERKTGASNGDNDGEWWVVTTVNGTQYWFGRNQLPGAPAGTTTQSVWTSPVFGNHVGEPCRAATFAASSCTQAYRWNLDYVVDPHGNTMSYWYGMDTNYYSKNNGPQASYVREGYLDHVDYGTRVEPDLATGADTVFTGHASARVSFSYADRCLSGCATKDKAHWPDTPWDLNCASGATCAQTSPSFWTTRRLASITTRVWDAPASNFRDVERWTLTHSYPDPQDGTRAGLWLDRVSHAGLVGMTTTIPDVTFVGTPMHNRVDGIDASPSMNWSRLTAINTETGALIQISYLGPDCVAGSRMPSAAHTNVLRCYPVRWTPDPITGEITDWFHKYVVDKVVENDLTGGSKRVLHQYTYIGDPAWHYADDDGLISADQKTWSNWRGYAKVGTSSGEAPTAPGNPDERTYSETLYFRGMHGDKMPTGTRTANVTDSLGGSVPDEEAYSGMIRETRTFNGVGGAEVSGSINDPWQSAATATRVINGVTTTSKFVNTQAVHTRTARDGRSARVSSTKNTFDAYGMIIRADDFGDDAVAGDEQCMTTTYEPRNTTLWLMSSQHRTQSFSVDCAKVVAGTTTEADVIGDGRTYYDGATTFGTMPTKGDVTKTEALSVWSATNPTYYELSRSAYDALGRVVESWDPMNYRSATAYTPATTGPVTQTVDTNPRGWTTTTTVEPALGLMTSTVDQNGRRTDLAYDGLGRLTSAWLPGRVKGTDSANVVYEYLIRTDGANVVTTKQLNPTGGYTTSYNLFDGLVRQRQTQTASPSGGRLLTDVFYDTAGRTVRSFAPYHDASGAPGTTIVAPVDEGITVPTQTRTVYDGAGRSVAEIFQPYNTERWRTTTKYGGDYTAVTPPEGGTGRLTIVDENGRTTELRQFATRIPGPLDAAPSTYDKTTYSYNSRGLLEKVKDPAGYEWTYLYDLRGRNWSTTDPDAGTTTSTFDNAGRTTSSTDGRGKVLHYTYDNLNRRTGLYHTSITAANQLAAWSYDTAPLPDLTLAKGYAASWTRYDNGRQYKSSTTQYNDQYQPTVSTVSIPTAETGLAGDYTYYTGYNVDGTPNSTTSPTVGDLSSETLMFGYNALGMAGTLSSFYGNDPQKWLVERTSFNALALPTQYSLFNGTVSTDDNDGDGPRTYLSRGYELETGRIVNLKTERDKVAPNTVTDLHYTFNDYGTITKIADTPAGGSSDVQCFEHDRYERLTEAWTPSSGLCTGSKTLGGPAQYRVQYEYDTVGRRKKQTRYATAAGDAVTDYTYQAGGARPHTLTGTSTTDGAGTRTASYTYDNSGNTLTRPGAGGNQTLQWDYEGRVSSITDTAGSVSFVYDPDGNRLIRKDGTGKTLYLPDSELRYTTATNAKSCTRFYSFGGTTLGQRTAANGITWLASDSQGTADASVTAVAQTVTVRRQMPFGEARGTPGPWVNEKGFVGGTNDPTGLVQVGARSYDAPIGRFISPDPVVDHNDPQQLQGYAYAENSPVTHSDPTGLRTDEQYYGKSGAETMNKYVDPAEMDRLRQQELDRQKRAKEQQQRAWCKKNPIKCGLKKAATSTVNWVDEHKAAIIGTVAGLAVGIGCAAAIGITGVGAVACGALAGAVTNMVTYAIETKVEGKGNFSWGGMLKTGAVGAIVGGVMGGVGSIAGQALKAGASGLMAGAGVKGAAEAGKKAAGAEARNIARGFGNLFKGCGKSFTPETKVQMADGSQRPIKDVKAGDTVAATDPVSGTTESREVLAVHLNRDTALTDLVVKTASGATTTIETSQNHPFWDEVRKVWVNAGDLQPGAELHVRSGEAAQVVLVRNYTGDQYMYDLTVAEIHTFYVLAGDTPVLVHNCNGIKVSPMASDWATKGAHLHIDDVEVAVGVVKNKLVGSPIRLKNGRVPSQKQIDKVVGCVQSCSSLKHDLLKKTSAAMVEMAEHNWGNTVNRAMDMQHLVDFLS
ncbi:RHS repeat-associated protein [Allocatelliglobosispora scoriae]|uniref:RHS repeat-associated protein n=1 Tax=Allocatelliglobosispora scoriae TaxID=643052 RepID=A0A841BJL2_9ACTN|nr:polymorphic toxin-type HINT domain-containing protein [Allocatelliglobosispora scoriae]MBB5867528.1 RHS repeat-associated protein [Allocatelliglobosispora scoriae]